MMENNYRYSAELLDFCQAEEIPFIYASSASVYGAGSVFREEPAVRDAAQRLRLLQVPVRQSGAPALAREHRAGGRPALLQRLRPARGAQGPHGLGRVSFLQPVPRRGARQAVRRQRRATRPASSGATSSRSRTWSRSTCISSTIRNAPASSIVGTGRAQTFNDVAVATINAVRASRGESALDLERDAVAGR